MGAEQPLAADPAFRLLATAGAAVGEPAWAVGGYVRDLLLGRGEAGRREIDVVVTGGRGPEMAARFAELAGTGPPVLFERFGTAQVVWRGRRIEFASARAESYAPNSRKPQVRAASIEEDLLRRDFTVNALLLDFEGRLEDRLGTGLADLEAKLLRTPLDPLATFNDDPLRMLRGVRFAAQLGFELDPAQLPAMRALQDRLRPPVVSVERVADELRKMLTSDRPALALDLLDRGGLLAAVLPELAACRGVVQGGFHIHDVYRHTLETVRLTPPDLVTRLAAVFHDVGKVATAAVDGSFLGHETVGAELTSEALSRLRFSNSDIERVTRLVRMHLRPVYYSSEWTDGAVRRLARDAGADLDRLVDLARADIGASAYDQPEKLDELAARLREVERESPSRLRSPLNGDELMAELDMRPGPELGRIKARLDELVLEGAVEPNRAALLEYLRSHPDLWRSG